MSHSFQRQLRVGQIGEVLFYQAHQGTLRQEGGREHDFTCLLSGEKYELKSDLYNMEATPYFFIERYSNAEKKSPGGPWQALTHGADWFCYMFVTNLRVFKFNTRALVERLEGLLAEHAPVNIPNKTWTTVGYKIPREALADLAEELTLAVTIS
jgi:hypothetical protein